jgi:hypothetical protein
MNTSAKRQGGKHEGILALRAVSSARIPRYVHITWGERLGRDSSPGAPAGGVVEAGDAVLTGLASTIPGGCK